MVEKVDQVCAVCLGHKWKLFLIDNSIDQPYPEIKPCGKCNPDGKEAIGVTINEPKNERI